MKPTSETKGIVLMLLSIVFFTVNTLAIRGLALHFQSCTGWQVTLFRGLAGTLVVLAFYSGNRGLRMRSLIDRPKILARGILGTIGIAFFYITIIELGAARAVVINLTYPIFATIGIVGLIVAGVIVAVGQLTMTFAYRHLDVSKGASLQMLLPVATAIGAWFFFNERFGEIEFIGAALTLLSALMVNRQAFKSPASVAKIQPLTNS